MEETVNNQGCIYILTNPSFPDYVKIGYAGDIKRRLKELNRSECVPYAFRVYATYGVKERLTDIKVHSLIDQLNPDLRAVEKFGGRTRAREFYEMSAEEAYSLFENIAAISGTRNMLRKWKPDTNEIKDEETARDVLKRRAPISFEKCGLKPGTIIEYRNRPDIKAEINGDRTILFNGETITLSAAAQAVEGVKRPLEGTCYWFYKGISLKKLRDLCDR